MKNKRNDIQIIFLSDTHLGFDFPLRPRIAIRRRGEDFFRNFETTLRYAVQNRVDLVVHGGDLFFRSRLPGVLIDRAYHLLLDFAKSNIPIYIIPGNHERSQLPQPLLLRHPHIHIFNRPCTFIHQSQKGTINLTGFPFTRINIRDHFKEILARAGWHLATAGLKLLCIHQVIEGATVGPYGYIFKSGSDIIRQSDLPENAHAILAGHIHRRQELIIKKPGQQVTPPVLFSGSTERTSFAEKHEIKGFYHLVFSENLFRAWQLSRKEFIQLPTRPMIDFMIDRFKDPEEIEAALVKKAERIDQDAIIRINTRSRLKPVWKPCLHIEWFRSRLPDTVNLSLSKNLFSLNNEPKRIPGPD